MHILKTAIALTASVSMSLFAEVPAFGALDYELNIAVSGTASAKRITWSAGGDVANGPFNLMRSPSREKSQGIILATVTTNQALPDGSFVYTDTSAVGAEIFMYWIRVTLSDDTVIDSGTVAQSGLQVTVQPPQGTPANKRLIFLPAVVR